jgi:site-specific DNA recombinase
LQAHRREKDGWRLPAQTIELAVLHGLKQLLNNPEHNLDLTRLFQSSTLEIENFYRTCTQTARSISSKTAIDQRRLLQQLVSRIDLKPGEISIEINRAGIWGLVGPDRQGMCTEKAVLPLEPLMLHLPFTLRQRGIEAKIVLGAENLELAVSDPTLIGLIAKAHRWLDLLNTGAIPTLEDLASAERADAADVSRILPLAFLAPGIVESIVAGRQPVGLTLMQMKRLPHLACDWREQQKQFDWR